MTASPFSGPPTTTRRRRLLAGLAVVVLLATAGFVYSVTRTAPPPTDTAGAHDHGAATLTDSAESIMLSAEEAGRIGITTEEAILGPMEREVRTVAQVSYDETRVATVALKVDGWVERLYVNITGQPVRKGQPLLDLYSPMLVSAQEELLIAHRLAAEVASGTPSAQAGAEDLLRSARRRLAYWDVAPDVIATIERSGQVRKAVPFTAPVSGIVVDKPVLVGQQIMAGQPLYTIADLSVIWLEGEVFEPDLLAARPGLEVTAEFPALPGTQRKGRITYVYPTLDPETRTGRIRVELPNADLALKPGMYATIRFRGEARQTLTVPRSAVLATGERNFVFVADPDGMFTPRNVTLGATTDDRIEILGGLAAGERVVASGTFLLDAESNLGAAMGGMGDMPGMDMKAPSRRSAPHDSATPAPPTMPGMTMPAPVTGGANANPDH
ncbi:MAG TPA: efflux RND transporter periplasmic adaptor subunit [Gemmatimonadales bacterium]|nr:efflux RND transporter periplasmic adaptor subunit [Gemmatimonadales bacterium]